MIEMNTKEILKSYFSKLYLTYFLRWQISTVVMMPFMLILEYLGLGVALNLIIAQCIGSLIFFRIDKYIFAYFDRIKHGSKIPDDFH